MDDKQFSLENIPYGIGSRHAGGTPSIVTRVFGNVVFLASLAEAGILSGLPDATTAALKQSTLNALASQDRSAHSLLRSKLQAQLADLSSIPNDCIAPASSVTMHLPVYTRNFTDYLCSSAHILNAGKAMRGTAAPLPPSFINLPIGYSGRASSLIVSGTDVIRPKGLLRGPNDGEFIFGPSARMDYELEVGLVIGRPSVRGHSVTSQKVAEHIFGVVLLNDWSARDIQAVEMQPLGPHNGKSFATTISPWVITALALEPFACMGRPRRNPGPYIADEAVEKKTYDIHLSAAIRSEKPDSETTVCRSEFRDMDWTLRDLVLQQTVNGCMIEAGDILGSGTVSGFQEGEGGCLLEINGGGSKEWKLKSGETRIWIEDGDTVTLNGWLADGVGFGECVGRLVAAN